MNASFTFFSETKPRDFNARLKRDRRGIGAVRRRKSRGKRSILILAAVAVPAFAASDDLHRIATENTLESGMQANALNGAMPFETRGESFPGSAFYYLSYDIEPLIVDGTHSDSDSLEPNKPIDNSVARSIRIDNSGIDRSRALQCLTAAIYYEAASESDSGQRAVAQVVLNRVAHPAYPNTVCGVVFQGSERRTGCQFSFTCDGALGRRPNPLFWKRAEDVALSALGGYVHAPVGLSTHYHTVAINPYWAPSLYYLGTIGAHRFYRFNGRAGSLNTFRFSYAGGEPVAAPHPRDARYDRASETALDPIRIERAFESGNPINAYSANSPNSTQTHSPNAAPSPIYSNELQKRGGESLYRAEKLPENTGVLPQYANSGNWIKQPDSTN